MNKNLDKGFTSILIFIRVKQNIMFKIVTQASETIGITTLYGYFFK